MSRTTRIGAVLLGAASAFGSPASAQQVSYEDLQATLGEPVTTSVTGKPQRASEAPAAITIITRDDMARSPARDIPGLLKSVAGIDVNRWTAGQSDVAVRGGVQTYNPSLLVMVDGRQVYLDHYGMTNWALIGVRLEDIQQVELVRGPASAMFGFNAARGVINIITRTGDQARLDGAVEGGDHGYLRLGLSGALPLGETLSLRLSAEHGREDERAIPGILYRPATLSGAIVQDSLSGTLTIRPEPQTQIDLNAGYAYDRQLEYAGTPALGEVQTHTATLGARIAHDMGWGSIDGQLYSNWFHFDNLNLSVGPGVTVQHPVQDNNVTVAKASLLARLSTDTTLRLGGEYRANMLSGTVNYSPRIRYAVWAANAMIDFHPTDRVALTGAIRIDRLSLRQEGVPMAPVIADPAAFNRSFTTASFNSSVLVAVGRDGQLRVNWGLGQQSPSLLAFGIHVVATTDQSPLPLAVLGNPAVRPSAVWSGEIGYAQSIAPGVKLDGSLFYNRANAVIALPNQPAALMVGPTGDMAIAGQVANIGTVTARGAELSLSATRGRWTGHANYSWVHMRDGGISAQSGVLYFLNPADATPVHKVNLDASYDAGGWLATLVGRYTSGTRQLANIMPNGATTPIDVPDTVAIDAKLRVRLAKGVSLDLSGENLTKARGATGSPIWADRRVRAGLRVAL